LLIFSLTQKGGGSSTDYSILFLEMGESSCSLFLGRKGGKGESRKLIGRRLNSLTGEKGRGKNEKRERKRNVTQYVKFTISAAAPHWDEEKDRKGKKKKGGRKNPTALHLDGILFYLSPF